MGEIIYKPGLAKNAVLEVQLNGFSIKKGSLIAKGTTLDLVLGDGYGNVKVEMPDLYNLTLSEALFILKGSKLIAGKIEYSGTVVDSAEAKNIQTESSSFGCVRSKPGRCNRFISHSI